MSEICRGWLEGEVGASSRCRDCGLAYQTCHHTANRAARALPVYARGMRVVSLPLTRFTHRASPTPHAPSLLCAARRFDGAAAFDQDIGRWETSRVVDMNGVCVAAFPSSRENCPCASGSPPVRPVCACHPRLPPALRGPFGAGSEGPLRSTRTSGGGTRRGWWAWNGCQLPRSGRALPWFGRARAMSQACLLRLPTRSLRHARRRLGNAKSFNRNIGRWDTARVSDMGNMYVAAVALAKLCRAHPPRHTTTCRVLLLTHPLSAACLAQFQRGCVF